VGSNGGQASSFASLCVSCAAVPPNLNVLQKMKISATEFYRKGKLLPFISWKVDSGTTFGDHQVEFDFSDGRVIRATADDSKDIAFIHRGFKGEVLRDFYGTVESDTFTVTKRNKDWLSGLTGNSLFEIRMKDTGQTVTNMATRYDFHTIFSVGDMLELKLSKDDRKNNFRHKIEGRCDNRYQDLAEILACLLLHHSEEQTSSPS
jgi:hypothetical protein